MTFQSHHAPRVATKEVATNAGKESVVLIEQPDPGHFASRRRDEHLSRLSFFPDPDPPRLGHLAYASFNRLELLLARLLEAAPLGPTLVPLGAPLFGVRALDVGIAGPGDGIARSGGLVFGLFGGFCRLRRRLHRLRRRHVIGRLLFGAGVTDRWRCRLCLLLRLWCLLRWLLLLRLRLFLWRRGSRIRRRGTWHRFRRCRRDGYRLRWHPAFPF